MDRGWLGGWEVASGWGGGGRGLRPEPEGWVRLVLTCSAWGSDISGLKEWELFEAQRQRSRERWAFRNRYLRPVMGNIVEVAGCFYFGGKCLLEAVI